MRLPPLGADEVLIEHKAVGLNYIDIYHREGLYPLPLPSGLGLEAAGVVVEVGSGVATLKVGARVGYQRCGRGSIRHAAYRQGCACGLAS